MGPRQSPLVPRVVTVYKHRMRSTLRHGGSWVQRTRFKPANRLNIHPQSTDISEIDATAWWPMEGAGNRRADRISTYNLTWTRYLSPLSPSTGRKISIVPRVSPLFPAPLFAKPQEFDRLALLNETFVSIILGCRLRRADRSRCARNDILLVHRVLHPWYLRFSAFWIPWKRLGLPGYLPVCVFSVSYVRNE